LSAERKIQEPYVCIAVQSTAQAKHWNNGPGWAEVVSHLKELGYRVLCIDRNAHSGHGFVWNHIPWGAEDFTGALPLQERVDLLRHASFFIGLSSGLSWLAWATRIPVILISGFTLPNSEFYTPWRVFNSHGCNGCWDNITYNFDHADFLWCP
ncbi:autotransporter strand-loop-strand O-heptosyltransferase, partial [Escherichia coli]